MVTVITPSSITGTLKAPPSKSSMQRACAAALLHKGTTTIHNAGDSNDDKAAIDIIQHLGAVVNSSSDGSYTIESKGIKPTNPNIKCGESGLSIRMFASIAALSNMPLTLNGNGSLLNRPMNFFDETLPLMGVQTQTNNGRLPLHLQGPLTPANITIDGSLSSQFLTGLLFAFSQTKQYPVTITVNNLASKPYIDLTLDTMKAFGLNVPVNDGYSHFTFNEPVANQLHQYIEYNVEGDWSSASFMLVAAAIGGSITVSGLNHLSAQADKAILTALKQAGSTPFISPDEVSVHANNLKAFDFDATDCPDLFPPLVAMAACCKGTTRIKGTHRLQHKESNRAVALQQEFAKMGVAITFADDLMCIHGGGEIIGATIDPHGDHRIAMACAIVGLRAKGQTAIEHAEVVSKSYPGFFADFAASCK